MCQYLKVYRSLHTICKGLISLTVPEIFWYWLVLKKNKSESNFIFTYFEGVLFCAVCMNFGVDLVKYLLSVLKKKIERE